MKTAPGSVTLDYDPIGRLYQTAGGTTTRFQYDGVNLIAEYNGSNALQRRYIHGPGTDEPILWYEGSGLTDKRYLTADERGSIVAVTNSSGTSIGINTYDEYGNPGTGNIGRFGYTGQTWLQETGLWYYKARMYNPGLGRFMQTDPIGYQDGMNWYNYVGGDPVNKVDQTGMIDQEILVNGLRLACQSCASVGGDLDRNMFGPNAGPNNLGEASGEQEIVVTGCKGVLIGDVCLPKLSFDLSDVFRKLEDWTRPPEGRRESETYWGCVGRITSPENAAVGAAAVELGRNNRALYGRGAPAGSQGTSYISRTAREIEKRVAGDVSRGEYAFGAKTAGGAIGRGISRGSVLTGAAVQGFEGGKALGALQVCR